MKMLFSALALIFVSASTVLACSGTQDYPKAAKALEDNQHLNVEQKSGQNDNNDRGIIEVIQNPYYDIEPNLSPTKENMQKEKNTIRDIKSIKIVENPYYT